MPSTSPEPGEVWLADLGLAAKTRPVMVVSRKDDRAPRALVTYIPLSTQNRGSVYEVPIPMLHFLREQSFANVQGIGSLSVARLERKLGRVSEATLTEIRKALRFALELD